MLPNLTHANFLKDEKHHMYIAVSTMNIISLFTGHQSYPSIYPLFSFVKMKYVLILILKHVWASALHNIYS